MALTKTPIELSSTPSIVDGGNATAITIDSSENVGIGTALPATKLDFGVTGNGTQVINLRKSANSVAGLGINAEYGVRIAGPSDATAPVSFGSIAVADGVTFTERMRIDASGNLLVGTTTTNIATEGTVIYGSGNEGVMTLSSTAMTALYVNRSNAGELVQFRQGGSTTVGSIGTLDGNSIYIGNGDVNLRMIDVTDDIRPVTSAGTNRDAAVDLGDANARFKDLYLSGGAYLGGTAAANKLDDYEGGEFDPTVTNSDGNMSGISYVSQIGYYQKIGDLVWFRLQVGFSATTIGTGNFRITNLPFNSLNNSQARQSASVLTYNLDWDANWKQIHTEGLVNSNGFDFLIARDATVWANLKATDMANSTTYYYIVSGCYVTN